MSNSSARERRDAVRDVVKLAGPGAGTIPAPAERTEGGGWPTGPRADGGSANPVVGGAATELGRANEAEKTAEGGRDEIDIDTPN